MKKYITCFLLGLMVSLCPVFAQDSVFDGNMDNAKEVELSPVNNTSKNESEVKVNSTYQSSNDLKEQKFNNALVNLDDAQVELRQELANANSRYNEALSEKARVDANCKAIKKEIKEINKKMKNVDKSKKMINKTLEAQ